MDRYYTKGVKHYNKTEYGWCSIKKASINVADGCDRYEKRIVSGISRRAKVYLNDLLTEITEIRKIIENEQDEQE